MILLNIRLQMEALITQREGMLAENQHRLNRGEAVAYRDAAFLQLASEFMQLREGLGQLGCDDSTSPPASGDNRPHGTSLPQNDGR